MKTICVVLLAVVFSIELNAQTHFSIHFPKLKPHKKTDLIYLKLRDKRNLPDNFPYNFGAEAGIGYKEDKYGKKEYFFGQVFTDINLFEKTILMKLEIGETHRLKGPEKIGVYGTVGISIRYMKESSHNIYGHAAFGITPYPALILSTKYMYAFNKYIGVTGGIRFIYVSDYWLGFLLGVQIFTN